jgi:hypothetical protein
VEPFAHLGPREGRIMQRNCLCCHKLLTPQELCKEETKGMEAERKALGLEGVLFRYYHCAGCGTDDIFVDLHPLEGESDENFRARRAELEAAVRKVHVERTKLALVERYPEFSVWV